MRYSKFKNTVTEHKDMIYSLAYYMTGTHEEADDVTQEVLIRLWNNFDSIREFAYKSWLLKTTRNSCIDHLRKRRRMQSIPIEDCDEYYDMQLTAHHTQLLPDADIIKSEQADMITKLLVRLPEHFRTIVIMHDLQEIPLKNVAEMLDIPLNTVKVYLHRGRKKILHMLHPDMMDS